MDRFHRRSHSLGIRFGPAKIAGEALKKLFDPLAFEGAFDGAFDGTLVPRVRLRLVGLQFVPFWIGRIWMVCAHGNLILDIVGEFAP
jgi:hypothetical protein